MHIISKNNLFIISDIVGIPHFVHCQKRELIIYLQLLSFSTSAVNQFSQLVYLDILCIYKFSSQSMQMYNSISNNIFFNIIKACSKRNILATKHIARQRNLNAICHCVQTLELDSLLTMALTTEFFVDFAVSKNNTH